MAYTLTASPLMQFTTTAGAPLIGGKVYTYAAGTTTPLASYTDNTGATANTNPVILDTRGEAAIWLSPASYKFVLKDSNDVTIWTSDNLGGLNISPAFTGVPTAPTAISGTNTTQLATTAFVQLSAVAAIPVGGIILWSGSVASIPSGWLLCNGAYSTPNLTDRFILGAGNLYAPAAAGGSTDSVTVAHTHTATSTDAGHAHTLAQVNAVSTSGPLATATGAGAQTTGTSVAIITTTIASTGVSGVNANMPPYYALCYIIKT
jgi:microcystin-dependent protein